jgi:hypothetical protein
VLFEEKSSVQMRRRHETIPVLPRLDDVVFRQRLIGRYTLIHEGTHHRRYTGSSQPLR